MLTRYLERDALRQLLDLLVERGFELIGPTVRDGAIVLDRIDGVDDLPRGIQEVQGPGTYRLEQTGDDRLFEWAHGPDSGKRFLFPPRETIQTGTKDPDGAIRIAPEPLPDVRYAFVGLRACDLHAIEIQDKVFMAADPAYRERRERSVAIGVNCSTPGETCFCVSMGPALGARSGYDIALTELDDGFTAEAGTDAGADLLARAHERGCRRRPGRGLDRGVGACRGADGAPARDGGSAGLAVPQPRASAMGRGRVALPDVHELHDGVPTCFCHDLTDQISLDGTQATREREWASCFSEEFSHMSFGEVRSSASHDTGSG